VHESGEIYTHLPRPPPRHLASLAAAPVFIVSFMSQVGRLWAADVVFKCSHRSTVSAAGKIGENFRVEQHFSHLPVSFDFICVFSTLRFSFAFLFIFFGSLVALCLLTFCGRRHPLNGWQN